MLAHFSEDFDSKIEIRGVLICLDHMEDLKWNYNQEEDLSLKPNHIFHLEVSEVYCFSDQDVLDFIYFLVILHSKFLNSEVEGLIYFLERINLGLAYLPSWH